MEREADLLCRRDPNSTGCTLQANGKPTGANVETGVSTAIASDASAGSVKPLAAAGSSVRTLLHHVSTCMTAAFTDDPALITAPNMFREKGWTGHSF